jgi:hypothetical protein
MRITSKQFPDGSKQIVNVQSYRSLLTKSLYVPIGIGIMVLGGIFGGFGIILVYLGAKGDSHIKLFGQSIETADVGVASIFIGAVTVIVVIRALLKSADRLSQMGRTDEPNE